MHVPSKIALQQVPSGSVLPKKNSNKTYSQLKFSGVILIKSWILKEFSNKFATKTITINAGILKHKKLINPAKTDFDFIVIIAVISCDEVGPGITLQILNRSVNSVSDKSFFFKRN